MTCDRSALCLNFISKNCGLMFLPGFRMRFITSIFERMISRAINNQKRQSRIVMCAGYFSWSILSILRVMSTMITVDARPSDNNRTLNLPDRSTHKANSNIPRLMICLTRYLISLAAWFALLIWLYQRPDMKRNHVGCQRLYVMNEQSCHQVIQHHTAEYY